MIKSRTRVRIIIDNISEMRGVQKVAILNYQDGKLEYIDFNGAKVSEGVDMGQDLLGQLIDGLESIRSTL